MTYSLELIREKFKDLFEFSLDLIYVHDFRGKFLDANEITLEKLGYNREEINNLSFNDLISKDQLTVAFKTLTEIRDFGRQITPTEYRLKTKNGDFIYVETYGIPLKENGKTYGIFEIARDITKQKLAEQKLKESEEKYRNILESIIEVYYEADTHGNFTFLTDKFVELVGYPKKELLGFNYRKIVSKEDVERLYTKLDNMYKKDIQEMLFEYTLVKKDGTKRFFENSVYLKYDSEGKKIGFYGLARDITERKKAEQKLKESEERLKNLNKELEQRVIERTKELKESEERLKNLNIELEQKIIEKTKKLKESEEKYRLITENANDLIAVVNQKSKFEYINENIHIKILGFSKDELIGKSTLEMIHPDDINNAIESFKKGFEHGELVDLVRLKDKNGIYHRLEVRGNRFKDQDGEMKILMIARDITERMRVEKKLKESEEKYRSVLENIEEGYFELDLKGNYTFVNEYHSNFLGVPKDEMIGKNYADFVDKKYKKMLFKIFNQVYREEVPSARYEIKAIRYDGMKRVYEGTCNLKLDSNGKKIGFYSLTRDITERKKMEALKEKFTEQLKIDVDMKTKELQETISQQKFYLEQIVKASQFKTEFMGSMSHELRTPLNAIIGFTDLLLESSYGPVNEDQFDFLKDIKSSGKHLLHMIDQILNISKIEAGGLILRFQEIHLKSHIAQIKSSIQPIYEKEKLEFEIIGLDTDKTIYADPIRLKEIFYNLLTNAIKFTKKGKITLKILEKEDQWEFQVIDTGIGIAKEDFDIIFMEFKRVESPEVIAILGSGLGLPITRKLVYMHGGTISFTSNVGKGSTFVFTIPKNLDLKNQE